MDADNYYSGTTVLNQGCPRETEMYSHPRYREILICFKVYKYRFPSYIPDLLNQNLWCGIWEVYNLMNCHAWKALDPKVTSLNLFQF